MFLATCRASILRAASTSSSWAAHTRDFFGKGVGGQEDCGPRTGEHKENIQTLELSLDILVYLFILSHTIN